MARIRRMIALGLCLLALTGAGQPAVAEDVVMFGDVAPDEPAASATAAPGEGSATAAPEGTAAPEEELERFEGEFVVGATTPVSGMFFTNMWGNNTSDIDVRSMIHGLSPVVWTAQPQFEINPTVVEAYSTGEYEDGNKIYMIRLHTDLKYSDGSPIRAGDYVFSLMLFASPVIQALGGTTTNSRHIEGYDEYFRGETDVFTGLRLIDEYTFTIEIKAEFLPFFFELGMLDAIPYPMSVIAPGCEIRDDGDGAYIGNKDRTQAEPLFTPELLEETVMDPTTGYLSHPQVTSGPYRLTEFDWESRVCHFEINEHFKGTYDGVVPTVDDIVLRPVIPETMIQELEEGAVQLLNKCVDEDVITGGLSLSGFSQENYPRMGFGFISFACEKGPFQFEAVRQAVAYSIDVPTFVEEFSSYAEPVYGYMGIGQWMYLFVEGVSEPPVADEEDRAAFAQLSLDGLNRYEMDLERAERLLIEDGWTLNESGGAYRKGEDAVRYKEVEGELMGLEVEWVKMQDSVAAQMLYEVLPPALEEIGMRVEVVELPFVELIQQYYRQTETRYDMVYLATNFISIFDSYFVFNTEDAHQGPQNTTGYRDEELEALALNLRETPPGAYLEYCQKWVVYQEAWNERLPMLPLYSNIYFDFHIPQLTNYRPDAEMNWPVAIVYAYLNGEKPEWLQEKEEAQALEEPAGEAGAEIDLGE